MDDIVEIESLIEDREDSNARSWGEDCAEYLKIISKTQLLILKELRGRDDGL